MKTREKIKNIFNYLLSVKSINEKIVRNIKEYDKVFLEKDIDGLVGCSVNKDLCGDWWIKVDKRSKDIYNYLFNVYQNIQKKGENIELVHGNGLVKLSVNGEDIYHPIFTTPLELSFQLEEGNFYLKACTNANLENYFLQNLTIDHSKLSKLKDDIKFEGINSRDTETIEKYFKDIINILNNGDLNMPEKPSIHIESMFIIRKASTNLWREEIKNILSELDKGLAIPKSIEALVSDNIIVEDEKVKEEWGKISEDLLFPLPANEEQKEVAKRIGENFGVVVQGPPGTGKSHTIANLICHFLAHGKKVLVTSETDRALKVLEEKIPEEIRSLCISLLGNDAKSFRELEESVRKITDSLSLNPRDLEKELNMLRKELNLCKDNEKILVTKLKEIDERENKSINYCGQNYKLVDIAKWLRDNEAEYSWIEDDIKPYSKSPISEKDFEKLKDYVNKISKEDIEIINKVGIIIDKFSGYREIYDAIIKYMKLKEKYDGNRNLIEGWNIYDNKRFQYTEVINVIENAICKLDNVERKGFSKVLVDYYTSNILSHSISGLLLRWNGYIKRLAVIKKELNDHCICLPKDVNIMNFEKDFNKVYEELNKKGKLGKFFFVINKDCRYIEECLVDYKPLETLPQAITVKLYLEEKFIERNVIDLWNNTFKSYENLIIDKKCINNIKLIEEYMSIIEDIVSWDETVKLEVSKLLGRIQFPINMNWYIKDTLKHIKNCIIAINEIYEYKDVEAYLQSIKNLLYDIRELDILYNAIENLNLDELKEAFLEINRLKKMKSYVSDMKLILSKLSNTCPKLALKILSGDIENLKNWNRAWRWAEWNSMLNDLNNINEVDLEERLENEKEKERYLIKEIISKQTWYNQVLKISENEKRSLFSWLQAVKRIGKGKGKYAGEYAKLAQRELENCKSFIPVWIMPLNRVIENIKLTEDKFDVIIFDESSQSNIFALCALMRGKKAVIVGDDKQISPELIGIEQESIKNLINSYLRDIPNKEWFDLQTSLYDTALRVFPSRVMLKEHFRCASEIIGFSNRLCYSGEILPLRYPQRFERFDQPIVPVKVMNGKREEKKGINIEEAEAIVGMIYDCCRDRNYRGMTMGVISLLGEAQADYIQELLRNKIGEEEMIRRKIVCGDAYSFQGDERDIMFLSMVIGDNMKFVPLTKESDIRRFNVAASRAKNQMWLFYSIDPQSLNRDCVRFSILDYCINYESYGKENKNIDYVFYSQLQRDVYKILSEKNYNICPNVNIGGYKIDFVLEGFKNKVAIICEDQDEKTILNWDEQYEAQLKLKSSGWNIIKIRNIHFYRNMDSTMNKIFSKLEKQAMLPYKDNKDVVNNKQLFKSSKSLKVV
ncbi:AAA domain-containing protein [Clostridium lundense]|uniref:AAA domain-containing protein n=1 Tax=Clostridium lundense TaxID=319475 RepID=UPI00048065D5|nr:AAA domain-containing protein [Clostridium lundense]